ncbi:MAG: ABC transporter substrate-binding protein, partial [Pseudomonadota bacterium]
AMTKEAAAYSANRGLAEEVFLLEPDLVIAGPFTTRATVDMLKRLGVPVVEFAPANNLDDVRDRIRRMGDLLERPDRAEALITRFDADLAALQNTGDLRPRAATYYANGYTSGTGTLADSVIEAAGLANIADEAGRAGGGYLALESLVMADPDLLITGRPFDNPALADTVLAHPALAAIQAEAGAAPVADRDWVCGTPHVIAAIRRLAAARDAVLPK